MPRNTRSKHFSFPLDNDPCIEYLGSYCRVCFVTLSRVNQRLYQLLANDVKNLHNNLAITFFCYVSLNQAHHISEYITVVPKPVLPIMEGRPTFVNLEFYVKRGILPARRWRKTKSMEGYDSITFYDKSFFPAINEEVLFISSNCICSTILWPPPHSVVIDVSFSGIILKKHYNLRCIA